MSFLRLPEQLRKELKKPIGRVLKGDEEIKKGIYEEIEINPCTVICVGDKTTETVLNAGIKPKICVYDGKVERKNIPIPREIKELDAKEIELENPPGSLNEEAFKIMDTALNSRLDYKIKVNGEEDLITLAAIDRAAIGSLVLYGQPKEGIVAVRVDNKTKNKVKEIIKRMRE